MRTALYPLDNSGLREDGTISTGRVHEKIKTLRGIEGALEGTAVVDGPIGGHAHAKRNKFISYFADAITFGYFKYERA